VDAQEHFDRLLCLLQELLIDYPAMDLEAAQTELIACNQLQEGIVYLQITRGVAPVLYFFFPPVDTPPMFFLIMQETKILHQPDTGQGIAVLTVPDIYCKRRDIKTVNLLAQVLA